MIRKYAFALTVAALLILVVAVELLTELLRTPSSLYSLGAREVLP